MLIFIHLLVIIISIEITFQNVYTNPYYPVVLIPGYGGNQMHAKLNKTKIPHFFCAQTTKDYYQIWLNYEQLSPYVIHCLVDNIRLEYDNITKRTFNSPGVDVQIFGFGETHTLEYLDSSNLTISSYFIHIVDALVSRLGYKRGVNVRGAPFDWRKTPNELDDFYKDFTKLIRDTYELNNCKRVLLVAHSMGNLVTLYWLNNYVTKQFKQKYLRGLVSLGAPLAGSVRTLRLMASGDNCDINLVRPINVRDYQRSAPSTAWLMPSKLYWSNNEILVSIENTTNYTVENYDQFFKDLNYSIGYEMRLNTQNLLNDLKAPEIEMHMLYGVNVKTPEFFYYTKEQWPNSQPSVRFGDGDGTVNLKSLHAFKRWFTRQREDIYYKEFIGIDHLSILKNKRTLDYIISLVTDGDY